MDWAKISDSGHYSVVVAANKQGVWLMDPFMDPAKNGLFPRGFIPRQEFCDRFCETGCNYGAGIEVTIRRELLWTPTVRSSKAHLVQ